MELIDQLGGGSLSPAVVLKIFDGDDAHARRALNAFVDRGAVTFDRNGAPIPAWEARQLLRESRTMFLRNDLLVSATDAALDAFDSGAWNSF